MTTQRIELECVGPEAGQFLRTFVNQGEPIRIGRAPARGLKLSWDITISREHADIWLTQGLLSVRCLEMARNPIKYKGEFVRDAQVPIGGSFQIGNTTIRVVEIPFSSESSAALPPMMLPEPIKTAKEQAFSAGMMKRIAFSNAEQQLEILAKLPQFISSTQNDDELSLAVARMLLEGVPQAEAVAVVSYDESEISDYADQTSAGGEAPVPGILLTESRQPGADQLRPSRRLILKALRRRQSRLHIWTPESTGDQFTMTSGLTWAFACPVRGDTREKWCLYVSGKGGRDGRGFVTEEDLRGDLRFTELLAQFIGSLRQMRLLQDQRTQLSAFFSPKVIENLTQHHSRVVLAPKEQDITVLFCDLRGFSRFSEALQNNLMKLLQCVSEGLGLMTEGILSRDGAIADFQGDAVLGFWGWPIEHADGPVPACRAALAIAAEFRRANTTPDHRLAGLNIGIGIAHGRALAGRIGTEMQSKIGVFGPVVNQGSRLEGMTKRFGVQICIDAVTAGWVRDTIGPTDVRVRSLAKVRPLGMDQAIMASTLITPDSRKHSLTDAMLENHEEAVEAVIAGRWNLARELVAELPADDGPAIFLRNFLNSQEGEAPPGWDGAIPLKQK